MKKKKECEQLIQQTIFTNSTLNISKFNYFCEEDLEIHNSWVFLLLFLFIKIHLKTWYNVELPKFNEVLWKVKTEPQIFTHYKMSYLFIQHADYKQTQAGLFSPLPALYVLAWLTGMGVIGIGYRGLRK